MSDSFNRVSERDAGAFRRELSVLLPSLRSFARAYCGNAADADDMVQITCERALTRWMQWQGDGTFEHWLKKILINCWRTEQRSRRVRAVGATDSILEEARHETAPETAVFLDQVQSRLMQLPDGQREVLLLVAGEGMSYREVSELLDIPAGTVMSRLSRARAALIEAFRETRDV